jgi:hypothetical protein
MPGRAPGPIGMNGASTPRIDSGTAVRNNTPAPGGVGGAGSHNSGGYHYEMHEVGWLDMSDAAHAIWDALRASRALVGPIVIEQTGLMLEHIMAGLLPGLMMAIGVMELQRVPSSGPWPGASARRRARSSAANWAMTWVLPPWPC